MNNSFQFVISIEFISQVLLGDAALLDIILTGFFNGAPMVVLVTSSSQRLLLISDKEECQVGDAYRKAIAERGNVTEEATFRYLHTLLYIACSAGVAKELPFHIHPTRISSSQHELTDWLLISSDV